MITEICKENEREHLKKEKKIASLYFQKRGFVDTDGNDNLKASDGTKVLDVKLKYMKQHMFLSEIERIVRRTDVDKLLDVCGRQRKAYASMDMDEYKFFFKKQETSRKNGMYSAEIDRKVIDEVCPTGTVGNICYNYNYVTGQLGLYLFRSNLFTGKENIANMTAGRILDIILLNATKALSGPDGSRKRKDISDICNPATGMPVVYMGTALLDCGDRRSFGTARIKNFDEYYDVDSHHIEDFMEERLFRNFTTFDDESIFAAHVQKFRKESVDLGRIADDSDRNVCGPSNRHQAVKEWMNNDGNVMDAMNGLLVGDIDLVRVHYDRDRKAFLVSLHEGKKGNYNKIGTAQAVFYEMIVSMMEIGTRDLYVDATIDGKEERVAVLMDDSYDKVFSVRGQEIKSKNTEIRHARKKRLTGLNIFLSSKNEKRERNCGITDIHYQSFCAMVPKSENSPVISAMQKEYFGSSKTCAGQFEFENVTRELAIRNYDKFLEKYGVSPDSESGEKTA